MTKIVVMILWMGTAHGGPATVQGFRDLAACEAARPVVERAYKDMSTWFRYTRCVGLGAD